MSDRQWSKKHSSDQQARGQNIRLFVATTCIAMDRPQDEFRSGNRFPHRRVARPQHSPPRPLLAPDADSSQDTLPHQSEHPHVGKPHRRAAARPCRKRLGTATHDYTRREDARDS